MLKEIYKLCTPWAKSNWVEIQANRVLGLFANIIYPVYCKTFEIKKGIASPVKERVVVSLTSYPARIKRAHLCIQSILRQTIQASRTVLWLAKSQFEDGEKSLPVELTNLKKYGLEIKFVDEDIKSYKKIIYVAKEEDDSIIITCDDDALYPEDWIEKLLLKFKLYPGHVVCYRANLITFGRDGCVNKYRDWEGLSKDFSGPSNLLVPIGVGGVLYPPGFFSNVNMDSAIIMSLCPSSDDLWLKTIGLMKEIVPIKVNANSKEWFTIKGSQKTSLMHINVTENMNDVAFRRLMNYYNVKLY